MQNPFYYLGQAFSRYAYPLYLKRKKGCVVLPLSNKVGRSVSTPPVFPPCLIQCKKWQESSVGRKMKSCVVDVNHSSPQKQFIKKGTGIYRCPDCGCLMADINFDQDQYEANTYYTMTHKTKEGIENEWGFRWRYILNKIVKIGSFSTLLDVGAGNGYFVSLASREFGLDAKGLEISKKQIQFAKNIIGVQLTNEDVTQHRLNYDVVTCFNVIEHVFEPQLFLSALVNRIKPGGILAITTPNPACLHVRVKGLQNWNLIDPPHHINLFTGKALSALMDRNHLEEINYETLSTYINFVRNIDTKSLFLRRLFFYLLRMFNLGADHFLIVRKHSIISATIV